MQALGTIETLGLVAAIAAADAAAKAANVELIGYELTCGGGYVNVKVQGAVDAVQSAMDSAKMAAEKISQVISLSVIARPSQGLESMIRNPQTVGYRVEEKPAKTDSQPPVKRQKKSLRRKRKPKRQKLPVNQPQIARRPPKRWQLKNSRPIG